MLEGRGYLQDGDFYKMARKANKSNPEDTVLSEKTRYIRPKTRVELWAYVKHFLKIDVPRHVVSPEHSSPMDYLWYAFNADFLKRKAENADAVVWANRGGGKTQLCGILTLLDCIFKPEIQIRILSGSGTQALRLYDYFRQSIKSGYEDRVQEISSWPTDKTVFKNGAKVEVLKQSETSVRGEHVHKLRCDEVELFKPKVFDAAQFTTMSTKGYVAAVECISTMHKRYGLMKRIVKNANAAGKAVFQWNIWDVAEKCIGRGCKTCRLADLCEGKARRSRGYFKIGDIATQMDRTSARVFNLEMLCGQSGKKKGWGDTCGDRLY